MESRSRGKLLSFLYDFLERSGLYTRKIGSDGLPFAGLLHRNPRGTHSGIVPFRLPIPIAHGGTQERIFLGTSGMLPV